MWNYFPETIESPKGEKLEPVTSYPSICKSIASVEAHGDKIVVHYKKLPLANPGEYVKQFALKTLWIEQPIFYPLGSASLVSMVQDDVTLQFYLPVVDEYNITLMCAAPKYNNTKTYVDLQPNIISEYNLTTSIKDFVPSTNYTQLLCHNKYVFETRWCEAKNLLYFDHHFFFLSPAQFSFPEPFIVPGPRAPPFDKTSDQFLIEPLVINFTPDTLPRELEVVDDFCYIYGVFHNYYQLWHTIFDFMIPLYHFMKVFNRPETKDHRRVYVRSDGVWMFHSLMKIFSNKPITIIDEQNPSILMRNASIGIIKLEKNPDPKRTYDDSIGFTYDFVRETAFGMREEILDALGYPKEAVGINGKPLVLLIDRGNNRNIENQKELYDLMKDTCDFCDVREVKFQNMNVEKQISIVSKASVLMGVHGSGLTHTIWMHESQSNHTTHLIEVLSYNYTCRNWYNTAADCAGVIYHPMMNKEPPETTDSQLRRCWSNPRICPTLGCHDLLRDRSVTVEIPTFTELWLPIVEQLKSTIPTTGDSMDEKDKDR